jgi:acetyl-CoA acetyltransferase
MGFGMPYGSFTPAQMLAAMQKRRHMHEYGTLDRHFGNMAVASYKHAQRNPRAVMYGRPITIEDYLNSRIIDDPLHLYDYCLETDGSATAIITTVERARDLKQRPIYIAAATQGSWGDAALGAFNAKHFLDSNFSVSGKYIWEFSGLTPKDVDVLQSYENFVPLTAMAIESTGFCKKGEIGPFSEGGRFEWPDGALPLNTSGGNLAEAYTHGFEYITEAVRQLRGISTSQVEGAKVCLVNSGPNVYPVSNSLYTNEPI